jgi:cytoskeletal protein RodZ
MDFGRYKISVILILVVLIIAVFIWKRKSKEKMNGKKTKKSPKKTNKKTPQPNNSSSASSTTEDYDEENEKPSSRSSSGNIADDAKELFDLVHNDMASGMQIDAFEDAAGDLAGDDPSETFVILKQKYTQAIDDNRDPVRSVTVKDYVQVLQKS